MEPLRKSSAVGVYCLLAVIVASALGLRLANLSVPDLAGDEFYHVFAARSLIESDSLELPSGLEYSRARLFSELMARSFAVIGVNESGARLPSAVFGTLTVIVVFLLGSRACGTSVGLLAAFLTAIVPFEVSWSRTARMYSMSQFFFMLAVLSFHLGFENPVAVDAKRPFPATGGFLRGSRALLRSWSIRWWWLVTAGVSFLVAFSVQRLSGLFCLSVLVFVALMGLVSVLRRGTPWEERTKYLFTAVLMFAATAIAFVLLPLGEEVRTLFNYSPSYADPRWSVYYYNFLMSPWLFPVGAFFVIGSIQAVSRGSRGGWYCLTFTLVSLALHSFLAQVQRPKYVFDVFPLILILTSFGLWNFLRDEVAGWERRGAWGVGRKATWVVRVAVVACVFLPISLWWMVLADTIAGVPSYAASGMYHAEYSQACETVARNRVPGEVLIANHPLAALYYGCGKVDYKLDNGDLELNRTSPTEEFDLDLYTDARVVEGLGAFQDVLTSHRKGWLVVDVARFRNRRNVPEDLKLCIESVLVREETSARGMVVFRWDEADAERVPGCSPGRSHQVDAPPLAGV